MMTGGLRLKKSTLFRRRIARDSPPRPVADRRAHNALCEPSQSAPFFECLQPQNQTVPVFSAFQATGVKSEPLCEPSQNGCFADLPQEHQ